MEGDPSVGALAARRDQAVDAHVHVWSDDPSRFPWQPINGATPPTVRGDAGWLAEVLARSGVGRAVAVQPRAYGDDHAYLSRALDEHPGRFTGIGFLDPRAADVADRVARLASRGFAGVRLDPLGDHGGWLDPSGAALAWEAAAREGLLIELLIGPGQLPRLVPILDRWPAPTVVIEHMGLWGGTPPRDVAPLVALARHEQVVVKISALASLSAEPPPHVDLRPLVADVIEAFGHERVCWGSDMPWIGEEAYPAAVVAARSLITDEHGQRSLLGGTAERTFAPHGAVVAAGVRVS
jgi:predicted TIM-barrel fold metal-dependent hydrolase